MNIEEIIYNLKENVPDAFGEYPTLSRLREIDECELIPIDFDFSKNIVPDIEISENIVPNEELSRHRERWITRIKEGGIDTAAFYCSYHFYPHDLWGIYIYEDALCGIAKHIYDFHRGSVSLSIATQISFKILFFHELFHYLTDSSSTKLEIITRTPKYIPYLQQLDSINALEESLANRNVWNKRKLLAPLDEKWLERFLSSQPGAYGRWRQRDGRRKLLNIIHYKTIPTPLDPLEILFYPPLIKKEQIPVYILRPISIKPILRFINRIPIWKIVKHPNYEKSLGKLEKGLQEQCEKAIEKLSESAMSKGRGFEKINKNLFAARVNRKYRIIIYLHERHSGCENPDFYALLDVISHKVVDRGFKDYSQRITWTHGEECLTELVAQKLSNV